MTLSYPIIDDVSRGEGWLGRTAGVLGEVTLVVVGARLFGCAGRDGAPELLTVAAVVTLSGVDWTAAGSVEDAALEESVSAVDSRPGLQPSGTKSVKAIPTAMTLPSPPIFISRFSRASPRAAQPAA